MFRRYMNEDFLKVSIVQAFIKKSCNLEMPIYVSKDCKFYIFVPMLTISSFSDEK